jgi:hypothetical protein
MRNHTYQKFNTQALAKNIFIRSFKKLQPLQPRLVSARDSVKLIAQHPRNIDLLTPRLMNDLKVDACRAEGWKSG